MIHVPGMREFTHHIQTYKCLTVSIIILQMVQCIGIHNHNEKRPKEKESKQNGGRADVHGDAVLLHGALEVTVAQCHDC